MATGDRLAIWNAPHGSPPASIPALPGLRNAQPHWAFDAATDWEIVFEDVMPSYYGAGAIDVKCFFRMATATSGNIVLQTAFERIGTAQDTDADDFAAFQSSGAVSVPGTAGLVKVATVAHTSGQVDGVATGEKFRLKVRRDADDTSATDSATGNLELVAVELVEA